VIPARVPCSSPGCWRLTPVNATCDRCEKPLCGWCDRLGGGLCFAHRERMASAPEARMRPDEPAIPATAEPSAPVACGRDRRQA
jgi:hypothetical protein